jgi:ribonuclease HI
LTEAQAFVDGQPQAKRFKSDNSFNDNVIKSGFNRKRKITSTSNKTSKADFNKNKDDSSGDSDIEFLNIPEYKNEPSTSTRVVSETSNAQASSSKKSYGLGIQFEAPAPTTLKKFKTENFHVDSHDFVHVYTDGSCVNNGKYTAAAGYGVYFGDNHSLNQSEPVEGRPTNNCGEIQAAISAIEYAQIYKIKKLKIFTDSQFLINAACLWIKNWKKKNWKLSTGKSVVNVKDFKRLDELLNKDIIVQFCYIPAHKGFHGNEEADKLAKEGASRYMTKKEIDAMDDLMGCY